MSPQPRKDFMTAAPPRPAPTKPLLAALSGVRQPVPPLWLMRQAGRYLPEYRAIRSKAKSFLDFCYTPELATEATLQPIRRFGFDAAILFSDILVAPDALGQRVSFEEGEGPRLKPIETAADLAALRDAPDWSRLAPVFETVTRARATLTDDVALIGFCGAPWTVASYMIAGRGTPDQAPARLFAYRNPDLFAALIDMLVEFSAAYLERQLRAGAEAVQIFDSWAGVLPPAEFERWCVAPIAGIVAKLRAALPAAPIIAFPRGAATQLGKFAAIDGLAAIGLDTAVDPRVAAAALPARFALQGNLDPLALIVGGRALDEGVDRTLLGFAGRAHVFNLGHGILPETPIAHVERLVARLRAAG
ncbi:MAG: uroporphyrinogen decarboxylase [Roseiarcus sp.]|jgi:uroporphyrinogen decarboxylase